MSRKPTLLILASTYPRWANDPEPGFVHQLASRLTDHFRVLVLCPHAPGALQQEIMDGVEVHRYRYAPIALETLVNDGGIVTNLRLAKWKLLLVPGFVLAQAWQAWRLARREYVQIVHAHWLLPQGLIAALLRYLPGTQIPFVVTSHGADLFALRGALPEALKRFVTRKAAAVTVVSQAMRDQLQAIGASTERVSVMPMGVDLCHRFVLLEPTPRSEREILFVGRLVEKKGMRHLLDAMTLVLQQFPDSKLVIAGFGPEQSRLEAQAQGLGIASGIEFLGPVSQSLLPALYRRAALFIAPFVQADSGDIEGLGLVLVEAIGCGCPVLAGNVPAVADVFEAFPSMLVDPRDTVEFAARIGALLADPANAREQASRLRAQISNRFDWPNVAARYSRLLTDSVRQT